MNGSSEKWPQYRITRELENGDRDSSDWAVSLDDLVWGTQKIAAELGVRRETIHYHAGRDGFPESCGEISGSKVWLAGDVLEWDRTRNGSPG